MPRTVPRDTITKIAALYAQANAELARLAAERRAIFKAALDRRVREELRAARAKIAAV